VSVTTTVAGAGRRDGRHGRDTSAEPAVRRPLAAHWALWRADLQVVLPSWLAARVFVALGYVVAVSIVHRYAPGGRTTALTDQLMAWDGTFYRDIGELGYLHLPHEALRFFPLYPLLGRFLGALFLGHQPLALLVIANVAALVAAVLLRRLVLLEKGDERLAERAVWLTTLFPAAFVLAWAYAEGLALLLVVGAFLAMRTRRWELAAVLGLLAALARPTGVLLAAPLAIEALRGFRAAAVTERLARALAVVAPVAGLALYLGWVGRRFGDPLLPFTVQNDLRGDHVDPVSRIVRGIGDLFGPERFGDGLHAPFAVLFVVLVVIALRRWPLSYGVFAGLVVVAALSADNLNSIERYALNAFPLMLALASITDRPRVERLALAVSGGGMVALTALAWMDIYVP
jgi:hypothetical protein